MSTCEAEHVVRVYRSLLHHNCCTTIVAPQSLAPAEIFGRKNFW